MTSALEMYYVLDVFDSPKPICEALLSSGMVFGGRAFGKKLGHDDGALMNGIIALIIR